MRSVVLVAALGVAACGGGEDDAIRPQVAAIEPAMAAVDTELGGPQSYFEVTAEPQAVRLFVATDGATRVTPYVYVGGELAATGEPGAAAGGTFEAAAVDFDPERVLDEIVADLDDPDIVRFSIAGNAAGEVQYQATVRSAAGGTLGVVVGPDGAVQSVTGG